MSNEGNIAVRNADIITMDPSRSKAEALAVRHGRIAAKDIPIENTIIGGQVVYQRS